MKKRIKYTALLLIAGALATSKLLAQTNPADVKPVNKNPDQVYSEVENSAKFPGGVDAFGNYLAKNIHYPEAARKGNIQGRVFLNFIVEKDGSLSDIKVLRGIGSGCDEEAVRVIKNSPKWTPGKQGGETVRQYYVVPVKFQLADAGKNAPPAALNATSLKNNDGTQVYTAVQQAAQFPGGINGFIKYLASNVNYPEQARLNKVQGKVFLNFIVEKDGSLSDIKVLRGIGNGCDEEAVRVIKNSPKWIPGKQNGKPMRQQYNVPINFSLKS